MDQLFIQILNMSITSCYVIILVMLARLLLKKCPKIFSYALWSVVLFRLVCPFTLESTFSLLPSSSQSIKRDIIYSQNPQINTGINAVDNVVNQSLPAPIGIASVNPIQIWLAVGELIWILGIVLLISYSIYSTIKLLKKLKLAQHFSGNIYTTKEFASPFVFGIISPKIYLPLNISKKEQEYILLHEQKHIQRLDNIIKPLAFLVVCLHWFNPFIWIAFFLMGEDMELSCDESVIKQLGNDIKKEYSSSLLSLSTRKRIVGVSPIAFGENNIKNRIKNILAYRKPAFWVVIVIIIVITAIGVGLVTNPKDKGPDLSFLNPNNLSNILAQNKNEFIKIANYEHEGFTKLPAYKISDWINETKWKEKKVFTPYRLQPSYSILNIHSDDANSEIRLYESKPTLAMVLRGDKWRYYTINEDAYNKFEFQVASSSYYEPFEITDNISTTDNGNGNMSSARNVEDMLTELFDKMMSKPLTSSNPYDYIKMNQTIFNEVVSYGNSALIYCFNLFEQGGQSDLKGMLMMYVCKTIQTEEENDLGYNTGQIWYESFKQNALKLKETNSIEEIEKYYPTYYLLLNLLTEGFDGVANEIILPDFTYNGNDEIMELVYKNEIENYGYRRVNGFLIPAVHIHGSYEQENKLKVFVTIYDDIYKLYGDKVKSISGSVIPSAITFTINDDGSYIFDKSEQARDGSEFSISIKEFSTYPVSGKNISGLADKIMNHYSNYEDLLNLQRSNLVEHLNTHNQTGVSLITDYDDSVTQLN